MERSIKLAKWFITGSGYELVEEGDEIMRKYNLGPYNKNE